MRKKLLRTQVNFQDSSDAQMWAEEVSSVISPETLHNVGEDRQPDFENSWANYSGRTTSFYLNLGRVYLAGGVVSGTNNTTAFTLPKGYRPSEQLTISSCLFNNSTSSVVIDTDGSVKPKGGAVNGFSFDGLSFRVV